MMMMMMMMMTVQPQDTASQTDGRTDRQTETTLSCNACSSIG